jgi:sarcosine oxidase subunit alpha
MDWVATITAELDAMPDVVRLQAATAWGYREHNLVMITERQPAAVGILQRSWRLRARQVIVAAGAIERTLVFENNDRPGVMLASAAQAYVNRYAVRPGRRAVVFTNNDAAYAAASDLSSAGVEIAAIVDSRTSDASVASAPAGGPPVLSGHVVARVHGRGHVRGVTVRPRAGGATRDIDCDLVCVSGGWTPSVHLFSQSRGRLRYDERIAAFVPGQPMERTRCAGAANGVFDLADVLADGAKAGSEAARACGHAGASVEAPMTDAAGSYSVEPLWCVEQERPGAKSFVDIQNDVTLADIRLAVREGFGAVEHVKRYTTAGMGIDQGKTGNMNVVGILADQAGVRPDEIGTTTFRSPYVPVEFGAIGGLREGSVVLPYRHTPMTPWHKARGAVMYEAGARWRRPGYYPRPGESFSQAVERECRAVREGVGVYDGSPLGKFEIRGANALDLIEMFYTNSFASLKEGQGRYGLMLTDDGLIMDDGVTFRLEQDRYLMSTSTANADAVHARLEEFVQLERPDWQVSITPVTAQWCNATICGPRARQVLAELGTDIDLSNEAFPFMTLRGGMVAGFPARVCRVSFTGELSFEINVAGRHGAALWEAVMAAGAPFGIEPVGSEASHVLRVEKGFLSLGHEADATVDPHDLGMGWIMSRTKADFLGRRAVAIRRSAGKPRRELVGLLTDDPERMVTEGAPLTPGGRKERTEGLVTACVRSVVRDRVVALALLSDGRARIGQKAFIRQKQEIIPATVVEPCFHDPAGLRLRS